jgi:urea transport system substrate-binding protein
MFNRRHFLKSAAAASFAAAAPTPFASSAQAADTIKIGSLYDSSGGLEVDGKPMFDTLTFAVDEINAAGGLLGQKVEVISFDTQSNMQTCAQYAQEAALKHKVAVVHGGITSASREVIRPILDKYKTLYFYDTLYEGGVCDRNTFCVSTSPGQTVGNLVAYAVKNWGKKVYTLAADYNYGQIESEWVKKFIVEAGGQVLGAEFFPLDATNFGSTIAKIQAAKPDFIMTILVGAGPIAFYRQFAAAGLSGKIPVASTTFGVANEQLVLAPNESDGIVVCYNYVEAIDNPVNKDFLKRFHAKYGADYPPLTELPMASYQGVHLWAAGVQKAGTLDRLKVITALESGITLDMPGGKITVDGPTHHVTQDVVLATYKNKQVRILESYPQQRPMDTAAVCDLAKNPNENRQFVIKVN